MAPGTIVAATRGAGKPRIAGVYLDRLVEELLAQLRSDDYSSDEDEPRTLAAHQTAAAASLVVTREVGCDRRRGKQGIKFGAHALLRVMSSLPARGEATGGEGVAEAAQMAGEIMLRSRVGAVQPDARASATTSPRPVVLESVCYVLMYS